VRKIAAAGPFSAGQSDHSFLFFKSFILPSKLVHEFLCAFPAPKQASAQVGVKKTLLAKQNNWKKQSSSLGAKQTVLTRF